MIEWFGTAMSVLVAISLTMKNIRKLRILNGIGAMGFAVYGFLISAWPVFGLNAFIFVIDMWYLWGMRPGDERFDFLEVRPWSNKYVTYFLDFHKEEIMRFVPEYTLDIIREGIRGFFVLRNAQPVSLILVEEIESDTWNILLDYAVPGFRDAKSGDFFFSKVSSVLKAGASMKFVSAAGAGPHRDYLKKIGFRPGEDGRYIRAIS